MIDEIPRNRIEFSKPTAKKIESLGFDVQQIGNSLEGSTENFKMETPPIPWNEHELAPQIKQIYEFSRSWVSQIIGTSLDVPMPNTLFVDYHTFRQIFALNEGTVARTTAITVEILIADQKDVPAFTNLSNLNHEFHHRFQIRKVQASFPDDNEQTSESTLKIYSLNSLSLGLLNTFDSKFPFRGLMESITEMGNLYSIIDNPQLGKDALSQIKPAYTFCVLFLDCLIADLEKRSGLSYLDVRNKFLQANYTGDTGIFRFLHKYFSIEQIRFISQMNPLMDHQGMHDLLKKIGIKTTTYWNRKMPKDGIGTEFVLNLEKVYGKEFQELSFRDLVGKVKSMLVGVTQK
jgi:hypothetical protein